MARYYERQVQSQKPKQATAARRNPENTRINRAQAATASPGNPENTAGKGRSSGGGGSDSGGGGSDSGGGRSEERYWYQPSWQDSAYNQQLAAINRALGDFETELGLRGERYGTDYMEGVRKLGYRPGEGFSANVDIFSLPGVAETGASGAAGLAAARSAMSPDESPIQRLGSAGGRFDYEGEYDPYTAAARGTRTARDEFAGRGMLRSSDFAKSYADFQDRLQDQLSSMERGRSRFYEDAAMDLAQRRSEAEERRQAARVNAMARAAAAGEYRTR